MLNICQLILMLSNGTVGTTSGFGYAATVSSGSANIESFGNGWNAQKWRIYMEQLQTQEFILSDGDNSPWSLTRTEQEVLKYMVHN